MVFKCMRNAVFIFLFVGIAFGMLGVWITGKFLPQWALIPTAIVFFINSYLLFRRKKTVITVNPETGTLEVCNNGKSRLWDISKHTFEPHIAVNTLNGAPISYIRQIIIDKEYAETCHYMSEHTFNKLIAILQGLALTSEQETEQNVSEPQKTTFTLNRQAFIPRIRWRLIALSSMFVIALIAPFIWKIYNPDPVGILVISSIAYMTAAMVGIPLIIVFSLVLKNKKNLPAAITVTTKELIFDDCRIRIDDIINIYMPAPGNAGKFMNLCTMKITARDGRKYTFCTGFGDDSTKTSEKKAVFPHYPELVAALTDACAKTPGKLVLQLGDAQYE